METFAENNSQIFDKIVTLRADLDVPIESFKNDYYIKDYYKINNLIPSIKEILEQKPKLLVIISHLGNPKGKYVDRLSLYPIKNYIALRLNKKIKFVSDYYPLVDLSTYRGILMLENIKFIPEEENIVKENTLGKFLSRFTDTYVNEAYNYCSDNLTSITKIESEHRLAGKLLRKELNKNDSIKDLPGLKILNGNL